LKLVVGVRVCRNEEIMRQFDQMDKTGSGALPVRGLVDILRQLTGYSETRWTRLGAELCRSEGWWTWSDN